MPDYYTAQLYKIDPDPDKEPLIWIGRDDLGYGTEPAIRRHVENLAQELQADWVVVTRWPHDPDILDGNDEPIEEYDDTTYDPHAPEGHRWGRDLR